MNFKYVILYTILFCASLAYDMRQLNTCVWLSGAAYCCKEKYENMTLGGAANGFIYKQTIYDKITDMQGYIGILPSTKSIYVVLRGSSSAINWLDDFEVKLVSYNTFPECNCRVHYGFYNSALRVTNTTVNNILELMKYYPNYYVILTGHSYGAACSQLLGMELKRRGINVSMYNYGQPRVGDPKYAAFVNDQIPEYYRTTHNRDLVPHVPPKEGLNYYHSCGEIFEDEYGELNSCSQSNCEDILCSDKYKLYETSVSDHTVYLGHSLSCDDSIV